MMARRRLPGNCFEEGTSSLLAVPRSIGDCGGPGGDDQNRKLCDLGRLGFGSRARLGRQARCRRPDLGNRWGLNAIAAAAMGGVSLMSGKGLTVGTLLGAITLGSLRNGLGLNGLGLMDAQAFYQLLATGIIILIVC